MSHGKVHEYGKDGTGAKIKRYKDSYYSGIKCINYEACPVCRRCENKGHYDECRKCDVKSCYHRTKDKVTLIKRGGEFEGKPEKGTYNPNKRMG